MLGRWIILIKKTPAHVGIGWCFNLIILSDFIAIFLVLPKALLIAHHHVSLCGQMLI